MSIAPSRRPRLWAVGLKATKLLSRDQALRSIRWFEHGAAQPSFYPDEELTDKSSDILVRFGLCCRNIGCQAATAAHRALAAKAPPPQRGRRDWARADRAARRGWDSGDRTLRVEAICPVHVRESLGHAGQASHEVRRRDTSPLIDSQGAPLRAIRTFPLGRGAGL